MVTNYSNYPNLSSIDPFKTNVTNDTDAVINNPEPSFLIVITPTLEGTSTSAIGRTTESPIVYGQTVQQIMIRVSGTNHTTTVITFDGTLQEFEGIYVQALSTENYVIDRDGSANLSLTVVDYQLVDFDLDNNGTLYGGDYDLNSPLINLFKAGYLVNISMYNDLDVTHSNNIPLFFGVINNPTITYDNNNLNLEIPIESLIAILNRSSCIQQNSDLGLPNGQLNTLTSQVYNFNGLFAKLINETIISQATTYIYYNKAPDELSAYTAPLIPNQKPISTGSAIDDKSSIFVTTSPTNSKWSIITESLYPYQRICYVDNSGNFVITPLQAYYDDNMAWSITLNNEDSAAIAGAKISINKQTSTIYNRVMVTPLGLALQFNQSNTQGSTEKPQTLYSISIPSKSSYFPRLVDFVYSGKYLQTMFKVQEINLNIITNSGLLNIASNINNIQGLVNNCIAIGGNQNSLYAKDISQDPYKYYINLISAKLLAEQLFKETMVTITVPTNSTYNQDLGQFRELPLNQLVRLPLLDNNSLDGIQDYFCYGYKLSYNMGSGAMTDLYLSKPYTYTALWSEQQTINITTQVVEAQNT